MASYCSLLEDDFPCDQNHVDAETEGARRNVAGHGVPIEAPVLLKRVAQLHAEISELKNLRPCHSVNALFGELVGLCLRPCLPSNEALMKQFARPDVSLLRADLIRLCGTAEGLLESHYAAIIGRHRSPHSHLHVFPYFSNYTKLAHLEFKLLGRHLASSQSNVARVAFVGSGPMPLSAILLALHHLPEAFFDNFDLDPFANELARELIRSHADLALRMAFHTCNIKKVREQLGDYEVVFLAALVGLDWTAKADIVAHLGNHMKPNSILVLRSAHGARALLYPVVEEDVLRPLGFDVLSTFHPTDEVVNSIIVARKRVEPR